ncbi:Peroxin 13, N-terminal region-domain-containing protein [Cristinia sonorae]|uniref:Peroxisomal membrane protein PEX13 n=1 Tax=Cristinia sonorae TaxID=1940300 RepID=A0A8K0XKN0_9AGAR|nr:Peroxin 13, N-terminal region-domain-containing protein [Cristinia sonorae]
MPSPPKPWELGGASATPSPAPALAPSTTAAPAAPSTPSIPARPAALASTSAATAFPATSTALTNTYGSAYNTPYNRFGSSYASPYGMNSMYGAGGMGYSGYGSYGGGFGGMNNMYGAMPGIYGGFGGPPGPFDPMNPSLSQSLESTTQHTFALLHSIVQTFSGVAQMLESTFMATHSSFFAMVGVIDQFGQLRNALGSVLGLFGLVRWMKDVLTGNRGNAGQLRGEFRDFLNGRPVQGPTPGPPTPKPSKKPLIIFLLAVFGVPYAMHKLVRILTERQQAQQAELAAAGGQPGMLPPLDPSQLTFARALYPFEASSPSELALKENEIVAVMGKLDPATGMEVDPRIEVEGSEWWKGRTREGREGWFPKKWVQILERKQPGEVKKVD